MKPIELIELIAVLLSKVLDAVKDSGAEIDVADLYIDTHSEDMVTIPTEAADRVVDALSARLAEARSSGAPVVSLRIGDLGR